MGEATVSSPWLGEAGFVGDAPPSAVDGERAGRRSLRRQIAKLEADLGDAFVAGFAMRHPGGVDGGPRPAVPSRGPARLLDLGELEQVRDDLARRLHEAQAAIERCTAAQATRRAELAEMLLEPGRHRFVEIPLRELGEPGCGVYRVRPRLGLVGMLMGWWEVKLSSGCPLAAGRGPVLRPAVPARCATC